MEPSQPALAPIKHSLQTLRDVVQDRMREAIIAGHFSPGERLVERTLCDQLGVSRTVIRETIRYLEAEGLVETQAHRGPIIARMDWAQASQIYDIRKQLESAAAAAFAVNHTPAHAKTLRQALSKLKAASKADDRTRLFKATTGFYAAIFDGAGHTVAWEIVQRLNGRISRLRVMTLATSDRHRPGLSHMTGISEAVLSGDAAAARVAVEAHIDDAAAIAKTVLTEQDQS